MTHEHEGFHIEVRVVSEKFLLYTKYSEILQTLLYMLIQKAGSGTLPPAGFTIPPWDQLAAQWASAPPPSSPTVLVGSTDIIIGHDDSEGDDKLAESVVRGHTFGWDNESPSRRVHVGAFYAEWRPVTNGEFERFWRGAGKDVVQMPKSWVFEAGVLKVSLSI